MLVHCPTLGRDQGWYQHSQLCWELRISTETAEGAVVFGWPRILGGDFFSRQDKMSRIQTYSNSGCPSFTDVWPFSFFISQLLNMASLKGFEHLMFCIFLLVPVFQPWGLCSNTQGPHCGSQATVGLPRELQGIRHANPIEEIQASSFKTASAEAWSDYSKWFGLSTGRNPTKKPEFFCMIFLVAFSLAFFRSNRWNIKLLPFWWFVRSWVRQKRKATWRVGESWRKDGIPHGPSRCLIRKLVQWCAYVSIYVFKTLSKTRASL